MRRLLTLSGLLALVATSLAAAVSTTLAPAHAADTLTERWCVDGDPTPCIESFSVNGVPQVKGGTYRMLMTDIVSSLEFHPEYDNIILFMDPNHPAAVDDELVVVINTGSTFVPDRLSGSMNLTDVDVSATGGAHRVAIAGSPVIWSEGCNGEFPIVCTSESTNDTVRFETDIAWMKNRKESTIGQYVGTNAQYNGIFFLEQPDGTHALDTTVGAPHFREDGTTVVVGDITFRLSYAQMRSDMGIPNPETLTPGSLAGTINGGTGGGSFTTWHDPDGGGFFIRASGFTFSTKRLKVRAARITPTRPTATSAQRVTARRGLVMHTFSSPRGARVTSYVALCRNRAGHRVSATGAWDSRRIVVTNLRRGKAYTCQVAARSKVGRSYYSNPIRIRARR